MPVGEHLIIFLGAIFLGEGGEFFPKTDINLPRAKEKLHCKGEPYRSSGILINFKKLRRPCFHINIIEPSSRGFFQGSKGSDNG